MKYCPRCGETKSRKTDFRQVPGPKKTHSYCTPCLREYQRERARKYNYKAKYGISIDDYNALLAEQDGRCAICQTDDPGEGPNRRKNFSVDHHHESGQVRGLLCNRCNRMIGLAQDDPLVLQTAAGYVAKH